jgi:ArsR family transcriptional regulator
MKLIQQIADCCSPVLEAPLARPDADRLAEALKVVAVPARLQLISLIATRPGSEACVCELIEPLGLSQPTVSHHLKVLHEAGLLDREKRGSWVHYRLRTEQLGMLAEIFAAAPVPQAAAL